jgi:hypothetical protein
MFERVRNVVSVFMAIVLGIKELASAVETAGHGEAKKAFVMEAFQLLLELDENLFSGFVGEKLTAVAEKVVELWVKLDKIVGIFVPKDDESVVKN